MSQTPPTIRQIAAICKLSPATVSRVLSGSDYPVARKTKDLVLSTAKKHGYPLPEDRPSGEEIAFLLPTLSNPFYPSLIHGFEHMVGKSGYRVALYCTQYVCVKDVLLGLLHKRVKGVVIAALHITPELLDHLQTLSSRGIKVVFVDCPTAENSCNCVVFDYEKGSYLATDYLIQRGHQHIVYAGMPLDRRSRELRLQGFVRAMESHGLPCPENTILLHKKMEEDEDSQTQAGIQLAKRALQLPRRPTAIVAMNDMIAFGILRHLRRMQIRVPQEISVIGFDDSRFCDLSSPSLTSIKVQPEQMGRMAAMLLLDDLRENTHSAVSLSVEPCVIVRDSVGVPGVNNLC